MKKRTSNQQEKSDVNTKKVKDSFNPEVIETALNEQNNVFKKIISQINSNIPNPSNSQEKRKKITKKIKVLLLFITCYSQLAFGQLSGVYPVGVGQVYQTITAAVADLNLNEVVGPVTFELWDNVYSSAETFPIVINQFITNNPAHTVTIKPKTGMTTLITGSAEGILKLNGCDNVIIDGSNSGGTDQSLTWENTNTTIYIYTIGFFNNNGDPSSNSTLKNSIVKANTSNIYMFTCAVTLDGTGGGYNNIVISNNVLLNARYGLHIAGVSGNPATNVQVVNNMIGSVIDVMAIDAWGIDITHADNTLIQGNEIMGAIGGGNPSQAGIYISSGSTNTKIRNNVIHDWYYNGSTGWGCWGIFYWAEATSLTEISNNLIYNIKSDGYTPGVHTDNPYGIYVRSGGNMQIYHNTIYLSGNVLSSTEAVWSACIGIHYGCTSFDIRNNILKNSLQPVSGNYPSKTFAIINGNPAGIFTNINNNDYYVDGIGPNIGYQDIIRPSLSAWQTATGQDNASVNIDPVFTSETNLIPTSIPLNHKGVYLSAVPTDITDVSRTNPPDVGAYEYATDPIVNSNPASGITSFSATLNGTINANTLTVGSNFEYGLTTAYGNTITGTPDTVNGNIVTPISASITGLTSLQTYHFRAYGVVSPGGVIAYGPDMTFTTLESPATIVTMDATAITATQATLNGTVNANNVSTAVAFEYGLTTSYGSAIAGVPDTVTGNSITPVTCDITGLSPYSLYHFRLVGNGANGPSYGNDLTFTTAQASPFVVTNPASNITINGAQLNGTVTANSSSATVSFEWGLTTAYGNTIEGIPATINGNIPTACIASLIGLVDNTTYHYRCVAINDFGTVYGSDQSFLTDCIIPATPVVTVVGDSLNSSAPTGNQWYFSQTQNGNGTPLPGATGQTYIATLTGWYWSVVTLNGCSSEESNREYILITEMNELMAGNFNIFPIPNEGRFNVSMVNVALETFTVSVYNNLGMKIYEMENVQMNGRIDHVIDLRPVESGIYTVVLRNNEYLIAKKLIVCD